MFSYLFSFSVLWLCQLMGLFCPLCTGWLRNIFSFLLEIIYFRDIFCFYILWRDILGGFSNYIITMGSGSTNRLYIFHSSLIFSLVCTAKVWYILIWITFRCILKCNLSAFQKTENYPGSRMLTHVCLDYFNVTNFRGN